MYAFHLGERLVTVCSRALLTNTGVAFLIKLYMASSGNVIRLFSYKTYLIFLFASVAVSIGIQIALAPVLGGYALFVVLALFIIFPLLIRKMYMNRMRGGTSDSLGGGFFGMGSKQGSADVKYVCLVCNNRYKGGSCPRCGSKMKRADF